VRIGVEMSSNSIREPLLEAFAESCRRLGHKVSGWCAEVECDPMAVGIVWNGRGLDDSGARLLCCENGWIPRSHYQVQWDGINGAGHLAPWRWEGPLSRGERLALAGYIADILNGRMATYQYANAAGPTWDGLDDEFLLVPLQMPGDVNMLMAPVELRTAAGLVDFVSECDPPKRVVFKQHPADVRQGNRQLGIELPRDQDILLPHCDAPVHGVLKNRLCLGVVTVNSNVAHDAMLYDLPVVALGGGMWPEPEECQGEMPGLVVRYEMPEDWGEFLDAGMNPATRIAREAYLYWLIHNQWTVGRANNTNAVRALLEEMPQHAGA